ncbi:Bax inhibitor-1/YccA family protein [Xylocopilactobacillus apis]|uniref:Membrane protein n=1 Tax=Xylocopilactobacillus apis TaxID=2932183 RepID=A0AAU9D1P9_9LACO|nr:Bax inhibitor-1/YccA family protein [Xylocopilactobacillus apis]BDR56396.1 membrane protein [Xylocopilactobacillus apis]
MQNDPYNNNEDRIVGNRDQQTGGPKIRVNSEHDSELSKYFGLVYMIMFAGVAITTFISWLLAYPLRETFVDFLYKGGTFAILLVTFAPLVLVFVMGHNARKDASKTVNLAIFFIMSACYGITLSVTLMASNVGSIVNALGVTAIIFLLMSIVGRNTKNDLQRGRRTAMIILIGVIAISIINIFLRSTMMEWIIDYAILGIFTWLIASDQQNIKTTYYQLQDSGASSTTMSNYATWSALDLYLDVLNIFMVLIEIFGGGNSRN